MPLSASPRFARERAQPAAGRRVLLLCFSLVVHAAVVLGLGGLARPALRDTPSTTVELMFDERPSESASLAPPDPAVAAAAPLTEDAPPVPETAPAPPVADPTLAPQAASIPPPTLADTPAAPPPPVETRKALPHLAQKRPMPRPPASESPAPATAPTQLAAVSAAIAPPSAPAPAPALISADWQSTLASWIRARTRYPEEARRLGQQGGVVISLTVGRDGQVLLASLARHSGSEALDQSALDMFRATRVPAFPPEMPQAQVTISVPVRYRLEP